MFEEIQNCVLFLIYYKIIVQIAGFSFVFFLHFKPFEDIEANYEQFDAEIVRQKK